MVSSRKGFTLIEMLVVVAISVVLVALAVPAFNSVLGARDLAKAAYDIKGLLDQARAHAMAQNTYVWVGFCQSQPQLPLVVGIVASKTGVADPGTEYVQIGKLMRFKNLRFLALPAASNRPGGADVAQLAEATTPLLSFTLGSGGNQTVFDAQVIQWNSQGEARVNVSKMNKWIEIGLQSSADGIIVNPSDYAAIQISGLSGATSVYLP